MNALLVLMASSLQLCEDDTSCTTQGEKCLLNTKTNLKVCVERCTTQTDAQMVKLTEDCYCPESNNAFTYCPTDGLCTLYRVASDWSTAMQVDKTYKCFPKCRGDSKVEIHQCYCEVDEANPHKAQGNTNSRVIRSNFTCSPMSTYLEGIGMDHCFASLSEVNMHKGAQICNCGNIECDISGNHICYSPYLTGTSKTDVNGNAIFGTSNGSVCMPSLAYSTTAQEAITGESQICSASGNNLNNEGLCNAGSYCKSGKCWCQLGSIGPCKISDTVSCTKGQNVVQGENGLECQDTTVACTSAQMGLFYDGKAAETCTCGETKNCLLFQGEACVYSGTEAKCLVNCNAREKTEANDQCACKGEQNQATRTGVDYQCFADMTCTDHHAGVDCKGCATGYALMWNGCWEDNTCLFAENPCSGHGSCNLCLPDATCTCYYGWKGDDCSEAIN